jgi:dephospho-CoA kinase
MKPCVIALSSKIGAGKSTIARAVSGSLGWPRVSFSDYVREVARNRGVQESRTSLQEVGEALVKQNATGFARGVLSKINFKSGAVVDGIRHMEILHALRNLVAPVPVYLIHVETDEQARIQRLTGRGMTADEIKAADSHSMEVQVGGALRENAALLVLGDGDPSGTVDIILEWLTNRQLD